MERILISACLVGDRTRYDGGTNLVPEVEELNAFYDLVPFCPEMEAGLGVPREPAEIRNDQVRTASGRDLTSAYEEAAKKAYSLCQYLGIRVAILKEKSPACGVKRVHNGRFDGGLVNGMGVTARYLKSKGLEVYSEEDLPSFLAERKMRAEKREAFLERQARYLEGQGKNETKPFRTTHNKDNEFPRREENGGPKREPREFPREKGERNSREFSYEKGGRGNSRDSSFDSNDRPNYRDFSRDERLRRDQGGKGPRFSNKKPGKFGGRPRSNQRDGHPSRGKKSFKKPEGE